MAGQLSEEWATEHDYPFASRGDLAQVMSYVSTRVGDPVSAKSMFLNRDIRGVAPPDFTDPVEPHAALARFPIPLYLTTNYDDFMSEALRAAGKEPRQVLCPWYPNATDPSEGLLTPPGTTADRHPVVYHLHGHAGVPRSLVLTEEDYIEFLVALVEERNQAVHQPVHLASAGRPSVPVLSPRVMETLSEVPLLFIGYGLRDWTFRVILHGILKALPSSQRRRHVSVQMLPVGAGSTPAQRTGAEEYLNSLFADLNISMFWGTTNEFFTELNRRAGGGPR